jgi:hypothetical protein
MNRSDDLARRAAHLLGLAGDFIDWSRLRDDEFLRLLELVEVDQPEMSDQLFDALSLLLQAEPLTAPTHASDTQSAAGYDPLFGNDLETSEETAERQPGALATQPVPATAFRVIRGGRR